MTLLFDANVLIALVDPDHVHHTAAANWFMELDHGFATCPITQGALIRYLLRAGHVAGDIGSAVARIQSLPNHTFWPDDLPFTTEVVGNLAGHRQVTDAYLCHLAASRKGQVATFDRGLVASHPGAAVLVPIG